MTGVPRDLPDWTLDAVDAEKMKILALLLADPNPLHFDPAVAPRLGIAERPVTQGPSTMAMLANLVRAAFPDGKLVRLQTRLRGSVAAGQGVRAHGRVTASEQTAEGERVWCELAMEAAGATVLQGTAEVLVPR